MFSARNSRQIVLTLMLGIAATAHSQTLGGTDLVKALRHGGYILVMRHAASPVEAPAKDAADPENSRAERQLDETRRTTAAAMGKAIHTLKIPVGEVLSSPTYRALETVKYAHLGTATTYPELGDGGKSMAATAETPTHWLQKRVTQFPAHTDTIIVTHNPNLTAAFPDLAVGVRDGETLVFGPDGKGGATLVARIRIEEWPLLLQ